MEATTLVISVVAPVIAVVAFIRTGGIADLRHQMEGVSARTEGTRDRTADALDRLERLIRGRDKGDEPNAPSGRR